MAGEEFDEAVKAQRVRSWTTQNQEVIYSVKLSLA
jgi:hypothetical protein